MFSQFFCRKQRKITSAKEKKPVKICLCSNKIVSHPRIQPDFVEYSDPIRISADLYAFCSKDKTQIQFINQITGQKSKLIVDKFLIHDACPISNSKLVVTRRSREVTHPREDEYDLEDNKRRNIDICFYDLENLENIQVIPLLNYVGYAPTLELSPDAKKLFLRDGKVDWKYCICISHVFVFDCSTGSYIDLLKQVKLKEKERILVDLISANQVMIRKLEDYDLGQTSATLWKFSSNLTLVQQGEELYPLSRYDSRICRYVESTTMCPNGLYAVVHRPNERISGPSQREDEFGNDHVISFGAMQPNGKLDRFASFTEVNSAIKPVVKGRFLFFITDESCLIRVDYQTLKYENLGQIPGLNKITICDEGFLHVGNRVCNVMARDFSEELASALIQFSMDLIRLIDGFVGLDHLPTVLVSSVDASASDIAITDETNRLYRSCLLFQHIVYNDYREISEALKFFCETRSLKSTQKQFPSVTTASISTLWMYNNELMKFFNKHAERIMTKPEAYLSYSR